MKYMIAATALLIPALGFAQNIERTVRPIFDPTQELQAMYMVPVCANGSLVAVSGNRLVCATTTNQPAKGVRSKEYTIIKSTVSLNGSSNNGRDSYLRYITVPIDPDMKDYSFTRIPHSHFSRLSFTVSGWGKCSVSYMDSICRVTRQGVNDWRTVCQVSIAPKHEQISNPGNSGSVPNASLSCNIIE